MDYLLIGIISSFFLFGFALGFGLGIMQTAHGAQNTTVSVPIPIQVPTLQYAPAIPQQVPQPQPTQQNDFVITLVTTAVGIILAKLHSDNKSDKKNANLKDLVKDNMGEILKIWETQKESARVNYNMNPEAANKITDAPAVKLETLNNNVKEFAEKAAKA